MTEFDHKTLSTDRQLKELLELRAKGKKIVLCYGHFNVIHPGHMRFLKFAKSLGDILVVAVQRTEDIVGANLDEFFEQSERCESVSHVNSVDFVKKLDSGVVDFIHQLKPELYVKGREFEEKKKFIADEINAVEDNGGKVIFSSGDLSFSRHIFGRNTLEQNPAIESFLEKCRKHNVELEKIKFQHKKFKDLKMLVIGDSIVDQFIACDALGVSSEAPVMAIRELESKTFVGGAGIVAKHLASLGAQTSYISISGDDEVGNDLVTDLQKSGVFTHIFKCDDRPTTFKIRYMVEEQKILRVSRLKQHRMPADVEEKVLKKLDEVVPGLNGIVIADFVYGLVTERVINRVKELAKVHNIRVFGDVQCSSQIGNVAKLNNIDLITPTEKEARIATGDNTSGLEKLARELYKKTGNRHLAITLGAQGVLVLTNEVPSKNYSEYFPALESESVDVAGAGDSMLAGYALSICSKLSIFEATALASCLAAISVKRVGNIPIKTSEIENYISRIQSYQV